MDSKNKMAFISGIRAEWDLRERTYFAWLKKGIDEDGKMRPKWEFDSEAYAIGLKAMAEKVSLVPKNAKGEKK